jgi:carboxyl-terminal processing protease
MPRRNLYGLTVIGILSLACYFQAQHNRNGRAAADVLDQISRRYFEPVDDAELFKAAVYGMVGHLEEQHKDENSAYISPEEQQEFDKDIDKHFEGIGVQVSLDPKTKELTVETPLIGSPAYEKGIRAGDKILKIDGRSTQGMSLRDSVDAMRGEPGKPVSLLILHEGEKQPLELEVERRMVQVETVCGDARNPDGSWNFFLPGHDRLGYVRLTAFAEKTTADFRQALDWLTAQHMRGLILDLRDNRGGLLETAGEVCDMLIPSGVIVTTRGRDQRIRRTYEASGRGPFTAFPMVVLVNQHSASASEIVAACLQDHQRALIVGQRTFGKGTVQEVTNLGDHRGELKLTVASYWRPSDKNIHRHRGASESDDWGVLPDKGGKVVVQGAEFEQLLRWRQQRDILRPGGQQHPPAQPFVDRQLLRAVQCLEGELRKKPA